MRRVTIFDDSTGLETTIAFEDGDSGTVITSLTLSTPDGSGVRSEHLLQLKEFGLSMPNPKASRGRTGAHPPMLPAASPADPASSDDGTVHGQTVPSSPEQKRARHRRPPDKDLKAAWKRSGESVARLAQLYGVPTKTAGNWIYRARKEDLIPPRARSTADADPPAELPIAP